MGFSWGAEGVGEEEEEGVGVEDSCNFRTTSFISLTMLRLITRRYSYVHASRVQWTMRQSQGRQAGTLSVSVVGGGAGEQIEYSHGRKHCASQSVRASRFYSPSSSSSSSSLTTLTTSRYSAAAA